MKTLRGFHIRATLGPGVPRSLPFGWGPLAVPFYIIYLVGLRIILAPDGYLYYFIFIILLIVWDPLPSFLD